MDWIHEWGHEKEELWGVLPIEIDTTSEKADRNAVLDDLCQVLPTLAAIPELTSTFVISRQPDVLAMAHSYGMKTFQNNSAMPPQACIHKLSLILRSREVAGILALSLDTEFITSEHLQTMIYLGRFTYTAVLAPTPDHEGTRAFLLKPPACVSFRLGADSFNHNLQLAEQYKLRTDVYLPNHAQLAYL
jgi:hypothetical protein